jgi:acyl-CoA thioesterase-1
LTEGYGVDAEQTYPAQLERRLKAEGLAWVVVNAGLSGETTSGARSRLGWVLKLNPDAVLLETGGNDGLRGIDPKVTKENLDYLVDELQKRNIPVMLAGMKTLTNMGTDYTTAFEAVYPAVAKEKGVPLIPFFLEGVGGVVGLNQEDRIHPTEKGYSKVVEQIAPVVIPWLKGLPEAPPTPSKTRRTP